MNIYYLTQNTNPDKDAYYGAIVVADTEEDARSMHPSGGEIYWNSMEPWSFMFWCDPSQVKVELIGFAVMPAIRRVVCAF